MGKIFQFGTILVFSFLGELLHQLIPLPIPTSIYGFVLLFFALQLKIVRLDHVEQTGKFLIDLLPLILTPVAVAILDTGGALGSMLVPVLVISIVTTVSTMAISGLVTQGIIRRNRKKEVPEHERLSR